MNISKFLMYFIIGIVFCGVGIWIIYDIVKHKRLFSFENLRIERNQSNERYEITPNKKSKLHASVPIKKHPTTKHDTKHHHTTFMPTPVQPTLVSHNMTPTVVSMPGHNVENYDNNIPVINMDTQPTYVPVHNIGQNFPPNKATFCTCGGLIDENCETPTDRVNSYNSGVTELSQFHNKKWSSTMPYDQFIQQPNYEQQSTQWQDVMPYDIYESQF